MAEMVQIVTVDGTTVIITTKRPKNEAIKVYVRKKGMRREIIKDFINNGWEPAKSSPGWLGRGIEHVKANAGKFRGEQ